MTDPGYNDIARGLNDLLDSRREDQETPAVNGMPISPSEGTPLNPSADADPARRFIQELFGL